MRASAFLAPTASSLVKALRSWCWRRSVSVLMAADSAAWIAYSSGW